LSTTSFFCTDTSTPSIYTLSLHDALPISQTFGFHLAELEVRQHSQVLTRARDEVRAGGQRSELTCDTLETLRVMARLQAAFGVEDRKSTRLNSSHRTISYAVFCLKKKKNK